MDALYHYTLETPNMMHYSIDTVPPGSVISVKVQVGPMWFDHVGVLGDCAMPGAERLVYSNSRRRGRGTAETVSMFAEGRRLTLVRLPPAGRECEIVGRARQLAARTTRWSIWWNCEHFVSAAYGEVPSSPQLREAVAGLGSGAVVALALSFAIGAAR